MQPSYGTNQTDLQMEITLVWFSKTGKLWGPFCCGRRNTNFKKIQLLFEKHLLYMVLPVAKTPLAQMLTDHNTGEVLQSE